jgi:hypothetical protein
LLWTCQAIVDGRAKNDNYPRLFGMSVDIIDRIWAFPAIDPAENTIEETDEVSKRIRSTI